MPHSLGREAAVLGEELEKSIAGLLPVEDRADDVVLPDGKAELLLSVVRRDLLHCRSAPLEPSPAGGGFGMSTTTKEST